MHNILAYYLIIINAVAFIVYGIDKYKAKKAKWRISEATLLMLAVLVVGIGNGKGSLRQSVEECLLGVTVVLECLVVIEMVAGAYLAVPVEREADVV